MHEHPPTDALKTIGFGVGVAPSHRFIVLIRKIALDVVVLYIFNCRLSSFLSSRKVFAIIIIVAPTDAVTFMLFNACVVRSIIEKLDIVFP